MKSGVSKESYSYTMNYAMTMRIYRWYMQMYPHKYKAATVNGKQVDIVDMSSGKTHPTFPRDQWGNYQPNQN